MYLLFIEPNTTEEKHLITEHLKLLNEKDTLVRRQDYLNILSDLNLTTEKILNIQKVLANEGNLIIILYYINKFRLSKIGK